METVKEFTVQDALRIQAGQLADWREVLKDSVYQDLFKYAMYSNGNPKCNTADKVVRGTTLNNFIANYINWRKRGELEQKILDGAFFG